jgi:hypothetical protein
MPHALLRAALLPLATRTDVAGAANHWRMIERASGRDLFLRYHDTVPSRLYHAETVRSAQDFVTHAARRNVVAQSIECQTRRVPVRLGRGSAYEKRCDEQLDDEGGELGQEQRRSGGGMAPEGEVMGEDRYLQLVQVAAEAPERQAALASCVRTICKAEPLAKVLVFAPLRGFERAERAVRALGTAWPCAVVRPGEEQETAAQLVLAFDEEPTEHTLREGRCRVLLLAYEDGAGLNLQHGCHHVVLFAPLAGAAKDGERVIAAVGKEQQSIGRVRRAGQVHLVTVHRLVLEGPDGERTVDGVLTDRNMDEELIRSATNTAET